MKMPLSFWEQESFLNYDVVIVGAGITGLSTACSILEQASKVRVLVVEKSMFPSGASTKNAGFACFGSLTELLTDIDVMGKQRSFSLVEKRYRGLKKLRTRFTDQELGYEPLGGYELLNKSQVALLNRLGEVNALLFPIFEENVFSEVTAKISDFGFNTSAFQAMLFNGFEGQIDTGKTIDSLWRRASELGAKILTGVTVTNLQGDEVITSSPTGETISFNAKQIVVCTNAFSKTLLPQLKLAPGRGQVLISKPIKNLPFQGTFHMDEGYYYFRNVGERVLFGGGRHLDIETEETLHQGINPKINDELLRILTNDLLPNFKVEIAHQWSGIMAFGDVKEPIFERINAHTIAAIRLGGMGMALGSEMGEIAAEEVLKAL